MKKFFLFSLVIFYSFSKMLDQSLKENNLDENTYFTTWATAIINTAAPNKELTNNSIRQIVHISASGQNLRLKLSKKMGKTDLEIKEITIADSTSQGTSEIDLETLTPLTFNGEKGIIILQEMKYIQI